MICVECFEVIYPPFSSVLKLLVGLLLPKSVSLEDIEDLGFLAYMAFRPNCGFVFGILK